MCSQIHSSDEYFSIVYNEEDINIKRVVQLFDLEIRIQFFKKNVEKIRHLTTILQRLPHLFVPLQFL